MATLPIRSDTSVRRTAADSALAQSPRIVVLDFTKTAAMRFLEPAQVDATSLSLGGSELPAVTAPLFS